MRTNFFFFGAKRIGTANTLAFGLAMILVLLLLFGLQAASPAQAVTRLPFIVNSPGDRGDQSPGNGSCATGVFIFNVGAECTLRAAIEEANATKGADTINFAIPGAGPHTISPGSQLPPITQPVTIDGYTESLDEGTPATPNTAATGTNAVLKIVLDGSNAVPPSPNQPDVYGLVAIGASNSVIRGLVISEFSSFGINLEGGTGYRVEGNFLGTDPSGTVPAGNSSGVFMGTSKSTLGGTTPDKRNLISANNFSGIQVFGGGNEIEGNLIGTARDGTSPLGNGVGSTSAQGHGVFVFSSSNTIGDSDPTDGDTNAANTIAFNNGNGVAFSHIGAIPDVAGNRILSNSIFSNTKLGINFLGGTQNPDGVTLNDGDDPSTPKPDPDKDTGYNNLQNYPVLTSAQIFGDPFSGDTTTITGELTSTPSTRKKKRTFIIQFFSSPQKDPSGWGEGKTFLLGEIKVTTDRQGNAPISFSTEAVSEGEFITATATNKKTGDTSEFSNAQVVKGLVIGP